MKNIDKIKQMIRENTAYNGLNQCVKDHIDRAQSIDKLVLEYRLGLSNAVRTLALNFDRKQYDQYVKDLKGDCMKLMHFVKFPSNDLAREGIILLKENGMICPYLIMYKDMYNGYSLWWVSREQIITMSKKPLTYSAFKEFIR